MSEEILEQQSEEELEEAKLAAVKSSGRKIKEEDDEEENDDDEEEVKEEHGDEEDEEEEVEEQTISVPKTKAGMMKAIYDTVNGMKKAELSDAYTSILKATLAEQDDEEEDDDEEEEPVESKKLKKEDLDINVEEDVAAIMEGEDGLSDDFKTKAATIFEAAVSAKVLSEVNERIAQLEEEYKKEITEDKETHQGELTEKVDGYLNYVVEEWMKENEIAIEKGIRSELVEDFMTGLKNLFQEHYIDIPEEKVDLVDDLFEKVEELEQKLDETINHSVEVKKELAKYKREETLREVSENLADTEKEKLDKLAEGIEFENEKQFVEKLEVIKENYFPKTENDQVILTEEMTATSTDETETEDEEVAEPSMNVYIDALTRHNKQ